MAILHMANFVASNGSGPVASASAAKWYSQSLWIQRLGTDCSKELGLLARLVFATEFSSRYII
jgi:hypothetical protein